MNRGNEALTEEEPEQIFGPKARARFYYERFLALRGIAIFINLLGLFFLAFGILLTLHVIFYHPDWEDSIGHFSLAWHVFLEMLSPARISGLRSPPMSLLSLSVLTTFVGFGFYSLLIAYASTKTQEALEFFRRGLGPVIETNHTMILGFDERVKQLIKELNYSNHGGKSLPVVIMSDRLKLEMDHQISHEVNSCSRVRVSTARGEPSRVQELYRINAPSARSAIILARCSNAAPQQERDASDARVIQTVKALYATQNPYHRFPIVAEIFEKRRREIIDSIDEYIVTFDGKELLASILVQSAIFDGIDRVYNELFSFNMSEFYLSDQVPEGARFGDLFRHFVDGVPVGVKSADRVISIGLEPDYIFTQGDKLLLIATDDQYIKYQETPICQARDLKSLTLPMEMPPQSVLIVGWHYLAPAILRECANRLPTGSTVTVVISEDIKSLEESLNLFGTSSKLRLIWERRDPFTMEDMEYIDPFQYDTVILLSRGGLIESEDQMDADTLMLVMLLRRLRDQQLGRPFKSKVITQLFRPENAQLINNTDPEHDDPVHCALTSRISTMLFTQLSEENDMAQTYHLLFGTGQVEVAFCPIVDYTEELTAISFPDLYQSVLGQGSVCIGFKSQMTEIQGAPFEGVWINPPKDRTFDFLEDDLLILLRSKIRQTDTEDSCNPDVDQGRAKVFNDRSTSEMR